MYLVVCVWPCKLVKTLQLHSSQYGFYVLNVTINLLLIDKSAAFSIKEAASKHSAHHELESIKYFQTMMLFM